MPRAKACDQPCGTCPWRRENQTPEAVRRSPLDGAMTRWFDVENLKDRWRGVADGQMMPCHATDPNAHLYGGKKPKGKVKPRVCVGLTVLARREITAFMESGTDFRRYAERPGIRMTLKGLASWASRIVYGGAVLLVGRQKLTLPVVEDDPLVAFPWDNEIEESCSR